MIRPFRRVALAEGVTALALFLVAMPLKYAFGNASLVPVVGLVHGLAWIAYMLAMLAGLWGRGVGSWGWTRTILAGLVPFGTFLNDSYLHGLEREMGEKSAAAGSGSVAD